MSEEGKGRGGDDILYDSGSFYSRGEVERMRNDEREVR